MYIRPLWFSSGWMYEGRVLLSRFPATLTNAGLVLSVLPCSWCKTVVNSAENRLYV